MADDEVSRESEFKTKRIAELKNPMICLDFDGVIHSYSSGWQGPWTIPDPPVGGALEFMIDALHGGFGVAILSSRGRYPFGRWAMRRWLRRHAMDRGIWYEAGMESTGLELVKFPRTKPAAIISIDDRGFRFEGAFPDLELAKAFRPWNKRSHSDPYLTVRRAGTMMISSEQHPPLDAEKLAGSVIDYVEVPKITAAAKKLRDSLLLEDGAAFRERIKEHGDSWPHVGGWHFGGGMMVRNYLREHGFGEEELGVANLDDVYCRIVELAVEG